MRILSLRSFRWVAFSIMLFRKSLCSSFLRSSRFAIVFLILSGFSTALSFYEGVFLKMGSPRKASSVSSEESPMVATELISKHKSNELFSFPRPMRPPLFQAIDNILHSESVRQKSISRPTLHVYHCMCNRSTHGRRNQKDRHSSEGGTFQPRAYIRDAPARRHITS